MGIIWHLPYVCCEESMKFYMSRAEHNSWYLIKTLIALTVITTIITIAV